MDFRTIDYTPLFNHARKVLRLPSTVVLGMDVQPEATCPEFISPNIVDYCGSFSAVCEWVRVDRFGYGNHNGNMWIGVGLRYESNSGGTNGMNAFDAYYTEGEGWSFSK
jgi:hypothetical protein